MRILSDLRNFDERNYVIIFVLEKFEDMLFPRNTFVGTLALEISTLRLDLLKLVLPSNLDKTVPLTL